MKTPKRKPNDGPTDPESLVALLRQQPEIAVEMVNQVITGSRNDLTPTALSAIIKRAAAEELEAANIEQSKLHHTLPMSQYRLSKVAILEHSWRELEACIKVEVGGYELPDNGEEFQLACGVKAFSVPFGIRHIRPAMRILDEMTLHDRATFPIPRSERSARQLFDFFSSLEVPGIIVFGEDKECIGLAGVYPSTQYLGIGKISLGIVTRFNDLGLREATLESIKRFSLGRFTTLEAEVCDDQHSVICAFQQVGFDSVKLLGHVSDGLGGFVSRLHFSYNTIPDEDNLFAAD